MSLHAAQVDRVLRLIERSYPSVATEAAPSVSRLLRGLSSSTSGADAWRSSRLCLSGFPVEISLVFGDASLRYTADVTGPEMPPGHRLAEAVRVFEDLSGEAVGGAYLGALSRLQAAGSLRYGAWVGGRHSPAGSRAFKIYAEVPAEAAEAAEQWASETSGDLSALSARRARPVMAGYQSGGRVEIYYRTECLTRNDVASLMRPVGLSGRAADVMGILQEACASAIAFRLPSRVVGFSHAFDASGNAAGFTLYAVARELLGRDERVRAAVRRLGQRRGWDTSRYEVLCEPVAASLTRHGMFGVVVPGDRAPATATIGLTLEAA